MIIHGLQKLTLLDFPGHTACTVFTGGCNFRCPFCHNASLVVRPQEQPVIDLSEFFDFLKKRRGLLDGVAITGGEPTLQSDLPDFIREIRSLGFAVKLDTNGYKPDMLRTLLANSLLDFIAMDIKAAPSNYAAVCGLTVVDMNDIQESIDLIMASGIPYEFRTTYVKGLHTAADAEGIGHWIQGTQRYFLQNFKDSGDILKAGYDSFSKAEMDELLSVAHTSLPDAQIRGMD